MEDEKFEDIEDMDIDGSNDEPVEDEDNDVDNINVDEDVPLEEPVEDDATETEPNVSEEELFNQLNKLFLPVVRMQDAEEPVQESTVVMEKNVFRLDDASKVAQLLSLCAMLIARAKDTESYKTYIRASEERRNAKIDIQFLLSCGIEFESECLNNRIIDIRAIFHDSLIEFGHSAIEVNLIRGHSREIASICHFQCLGKINFIDCIDNQ